MYPKGGGGATRTYRGGGGSALDLQPLYASKFYPDKLLSVKIR